MSSLLSALIGLLPLERCWMVLEQQESLQKKKKKKKNSRATELSDAIASDAIVCDITNERPAATLDP